jgi:hypothetical protein
MRSFNKACYMLHCAAALVAWLRNYRGHVLLVLLLCFTCCCYVQVDEVYVIAYVCFHICRINTEGRGKWFMYLLDSAGPRPAKSLEDGTHSKGVPGPHNQRKTPCLFSYPASKGS